MWLFVAKQILEITKQISPSYLNSSTIDILGQTIF